MKTIKRILIANIIVMLAVGFSVEAAFAATTDSVAASAAIDALSSLSLVTRNVSGDGVSVPAKTLAFGTISGSVAHSPQYIEVTYSSNNSVWQIDVYTNNTTADGTALPYQKAGLLKDDNKDRIPLYWCTYDATATTETLTLDGNGVPVARTTSADFGSQDVTDWAVLKDKNDLDDPGSAFDDQGTPTHDDDTGLNESWTYAFDGGYCDIMYGSPGFSNLSPFPYYDVAPETLGTYAGDDLHRPATTPAVVYVAAGAGFASSGSYDTNVSFDLYNE